MAELDDQVDEVETEIPLEDTIREAISSASSEKAIPEVDPALSTEKPVSSRPRDDTGKFAKADAASVAQATPVIPDATSSQPVKAPPGWNSEMRAEFSALPAKAQAYILDREMAAERKITANDTDRLMGKRVNEMATPYLPTIRSEGATVEKAFQDYLQTAHVLRAGTDMQKAQSIAAVMNQFKVNPMALISVLQGGNVVPGVPQQGMHNPALNTLQQRLDRLEADRQAEVQQRQTQDEQNLQSQIDAFSQEAGHEHFDKVRGLMGSLMMMEGPNAPKTLPEAYEMAINAHPEIRSSLAAQSSAPDKRLTEAKAKADAARRAGGSVSGGPGSAKALNGSGANIPIEETIRQALRESTGRL